MPGIRILGIEDAPQAKGYAILGIEDALPVVAQEKPAKKHPARRGPAAPRRPAQAPRVASGPGSHYRT
jgi:hypothetical protein